MRPAPTKPLTRRCEKIVPARLANWATGAITVSGSSATDYIDSIGNLLGAIAWPAAIVGVAIVFRGRVREFIAVLTKRAESDDFEVAVGRFFKMAVKSTAYLAAATEQKRGSASASGEEADVGGQAATRADDLAADLEITTGSLAEIAIQAARSRATPRILWVDDTPRNNVYERQTLEALGIDVVTRTSTEQALNLLEHQSFDVIISNMGRPGDGRAGYTLLDDLRPENTTPFIVYSSSNKQEHKDEAKQHGAWGATNSPAELLALVQSALAATPSSTR
jgi:CheY-like chemotaxis protein